MNRLVGNPLLVQAVGLVLIPQLTPSSVILQ